MNCQKAGDLLSAYIEGEVSGRQGETLEAHLAGCDGCREELDTLRSALALLAVPKTLVRPEGLLEEFKAKYLPEAEAAPAPRWGIKIPVLPKIEWPSLNRLMLPMGGMAAAGAAAALVVALHGNPASVSKMPGAPAPNRTQVAENTAPDRSAPVDPKESSTTASLPGSEKPVTASPALPVMRSAKIDASKPAGTVRHHAAMAASEPKVRRHARPAELGDAAVRRPSHRSRHRSHGSLLASTRELRITPPVSLDELSRSAERHPEVVKSDELRWRDLDGQGGAIMHKAVPQTAEDGYAEASCKNLATGQVLRTETVSIPAEASPAAPAGDGAGTNNGRC
jgi:hypothetical protein